MKGLYDLIQESVAYINKITDHFEPSIGIVLGTGLSKLGDQVSNKTAIPYTEIPHFPASTVDGHDGQLIVGTIDNQRVIVMQGRFHYYEGYTMTQVTYPIRVMKFLGASQLIISNASGGLNTKYSSGDIVMIHDHINYLPENPLRGLRDERLGIRFPDLSTAYSSRLRKQFTTIAEEQGIDVKSGIYLGLQGPSLETQAELRFFQKIGADLVGMSTVPEVIVARQCEMEVLALSVVTNECLPSNGEVTKTTIEEVIEVANRTEPILTSLVMAYIRRS